MKPILILAFVCLIVACRLHQPLAENDELFDVQRIETEEWFDSKQQISIVRIAQQLPQNLEFGLEYDQKELRTTSEFAQEAKALVALNGGFFNVDEGGSIAYLEVNDKVIQPTPTGTGKWLKPDSLVNGVIIIDKQGMFEVDMREEDEVYVQSHAEKAVLVSGPLLIDDNHAVRLISSDFATARHPRSCLCLKEDKEVLFIVVDGRSDKADGMTLSELQQFAIEIGCSDAINLDGGGSSALWTKQEGIINQPSDKDGERTVANILYLREKVK